jgi:hypothetical protein
MGSVPTSPKLLFQASVASQLTGLTRSQLREWTDRKRRGLILPDVEAEGPGRHALYGWPTLLVLRLLLTLHNDFAAEVCAWADAAKALRQQFDRTPFQSLWRMSAHFPSRETANLIDQATQAEYTGIMLPLDPHLSALAIGLALPPPDQLSLFSAIVVSR